ncbi:MAG: class I SAM-dependent methyltransferase [Planctomycetes bacterium]|nr:class I SAM-dependent methyltransferase [Planctomycetota bacterium]
MRSAVLEHVPFPAYALLDSGNAEKLEDFGGVVLRRPDPQALWTPRLAPAEWARADLSFVRESDRGGRWEARRDADPRARGAQPAWELAFDACRFVVRPTPFKHVGLFPEQAANWRLLVEVRTSFATERPRMLDLFGYTGAASVVAAKAGYEVTHVDASKTSLAWARENAAASGLAADAVRWVLDDALAYARREVRRGRPYHVLLLDPPHFGRGPQGETWRFEQGIAPLVDAARQLVAERALVVLSTYAIGTSPLALENLVASLGPGAVEAGELALPEQGPGGRRLPAGFCARWSRGIGR